MTPVWGNMIGAAALLGLGGALTGCSTVCPAIGWASVITVNLEGNTDHVDTVQLCAGESCSQLNSVPIPAPRTASKSAVPDATNPPGPSTYPTIIPFYGSKTDEDSWQFTVAMQSPDRVTVRALSVKGEVLAEKEAALDWKRVGGSAECGGPMTSDPITLTVGGVGLRTLR